jgi:L-threonylcarbamoyladenylate synthase
MKELVAALEAGLVVAAATESFFGLLADATSSAALDTLLRVKPRGADKGIPLILPDAKSWSLLVPEVPAVARALADALWPGALSIALPARAELDRRVTLDGSVAVRVAAASPAAELARLFGKPLTATSANLPGDPPTTDDAGVMAQLGPAVASGLLRVLPGTSPGGLPSTLVELGGTRARIVREGRVPRDTVAEVLARAGARLDEAGLPS